MYNFKFILDSFLHFFQLCFPSTYVHVSHTATLLLHKDTESLHSASKLLACLLFAPVSIFPAPGSGMKLPESLLDRWRIKLGIVLFSLILKDIFFFTGRGTDLSIVY